MRQLRRTLTIGGTVLLVFTVSTVAQTSARRLRTLHQFTGSPSDGAYSTAGVAIGSGGVLYGATGNGGSGTCYQGCGMLFALTPPADLGGSWTEEVLYNFTGGTGGAAPGGVVVGGTGVLYGVTEDGGTGLCSGPLDGCGTAFSLTPPALPGDSWSETVLHDFSNTGSDGSTPDGIVIGSGGVHYGTTYFGGRGDGTVFSLKPPASPGDAWTEKVLYEFGSDTRDGSLPIASTVIGGGGVLYGTTTGGGATNQGTVFSLTPPRVPGGSWTEAVLYEFNVASDGSGHSGVVIGSGGVLYGTTATGGAQNQGTVFSLSPPTSPGGPWIKTVLYDFRGSHDGGFPGANVTVDKSGLLYGTTIYGGVFGWGTVFQLTPPAMPGGSWIETVLHNFTNGSDGGNPQAAVIIGAGGMLYGTTHEGGNGTFGTVFSLKP